MQDEIKDLQDEIIELEKEKEALENNENTGEYDDWIDEAGDVKIGSLSYSPSHALKQIDPIAYNCGLNDYNDERLGEIDDEIKEKQDEIEDLKD